MKTPRFILNLPIIVFGLLSTYYLVGQETGSYSLLNSYLGLFSGIITIAYTLIYVLYITYFKIFKKHKFDFYPLFSISIVIWIFFSVKIYERKGGEVKITAVIQNCIDNKRYNIIELTLEKENKYFLGFHDSHYGCREKGSYQILGDSLILNRESEKCVYQLDYQILKIDNIKNRIYLYDKIGLLDSTAYFEIK